MIGTRTTNSAGGYLFDGLGDGTYVVRVVPSTLPTGVTNTFGGTQQSATITGASTDLSKDFGYQPAGTISGRVFNDFDANGSQNGTEPGIPGAVVELVDSNGDVIATTTTGPDGSYVFDHLPDGAYTVRVAPGWSRRASTRRRRRRGPRRSSAGPTSLNVNFGYDSPTGAIGDRVWFDVDGDGVQDAGEQGIPGVTLELLNAAGQVIATTVTNSAGGYLFDGLGDGTYVVRVVPSTLPTGVTNTFGGTQQSATITGASTDLSKDFGYQPAGTISGRVFHDPDANGSQNGRSPASRARSSSSSTRTASDRHDDHRPRRLVRLRPPPRRRLHGARRAGLGPDGPQPDDADVAARDDRRRGRRPERELRLRLPHRRDRRPRLVRRRRRRRPGRGRAGHPGRDARTR